MARFSIYCALPSTSAGPKHAPHTHDERSTGGGDAGRATRRGVRVGAQTTMSMCTRDRAWGLRGVGWGRGGRIGTCGCVAG